MEMFLQTQYNEQLQERASENMGAMKNMMHFVPNKAKETHNNWPDLNPSLNYGHEVYRCILKTHEINFQLYIATTITLQ